MLIIWRVTRHRVCVLSQITRNYDKTLHKETGNKALKVCQESPFDIYFNFCRVAKSEKQAFKTLTRIGLKFPSENQFTVRLVLITYTSNEFYLFIFLFIFSCNGSPMNLLFAFRSILCLLANWYISWSCYYISVRFCCVLTKSNQPRTVKNFTYFNPIIPYENKIFQTK